MPYSPQNQLRFQAPHFAPRHKPEARSQEPLSPRASPAQSPSPYLSDTPHPALAPENCNRPTSPLHTIQIPTKPRASAPPAPRSFLRIGIPTLHLPHPFPLLPRLRPAPHRDQGTPATPPASPQFRSLNTASSASSPAPHLPHPASSARPLPPPRLPGWSRLFARSHWAVQPDETRFATARSAPAAAQVPLASPIP